MLTITHAVHVSMSNPALLGANSGTPSLQDIFSKQTYGSF